MRAKIKVAKDWLESKTMVKGIGLPALKLIIVEISDEFVDRFLTKSCFLTAESEKISEAEIHIWEKIYIDRRIILKWVGLEENTIKVLVDEPLAKVRSITK
jgi:hypothetical protein